MRAQHQPQTRHDSSIFPALVGLFCGSEQRTPDFRRHFLHRRQNQIESRISEGMPEYRVISSPAFLVRVVRIIVYFVIHGTATLRLAFHGLKIEDSRTMTRGLIFGETGAPRD